VAGSIFATILRSSLTPEQLESWGWRIPFLLGALVGVAGAWLRSSGIVDDSDGDDVGENNFSGAIDLEGQCEKAGSNKESKQQTEPESRTENPLLATFKVQNLRPLLGSFLAASLWAVGFYVLFLWLPVAMSSPSDAAVVVPNAFWINIASLSLTQALLFPMVGLLSDRYGRRPVMTFGAAGLAVGSPLLIGLIGRTGDPWIAFFSQSSLGLLLALWASPMLSWFIESFHASHRVSSIGVAYNVAMAVLGGTAPTIATAMVDGAGGFAAPGYLVSAVSVLGLAGVWIVAPRRAVVPACSTDGYERIELWSGSTTLSLFSCCCTVVAFASDGVGPRQQELLGEVTTKILYCTRAESSRVESNESLK